jgi:hypothetical protein
MTFNRTHSDAPLPATLVEDTNRWVSMNLQATLSTLPIEVQKFAELHEIKTAINSTTKYSASLNKRLEEVENYLSGPLKYVLDRFDLYEERIKALEDKLSKLLTVIEPSEVALQLTSDKHEIRKMAEEIMDLKRALISGVANVK